MYNGALSAALSRAGAACERADVQGALRSLRDRRHGAYWVDSLYLSWLPELARENVARAPLRLLVHYLPSLVSHGDATTRGELLGAERAALDAADGFLVTSAYMARILGRLGVERRKIVVIEPGVTITEPLAVLEERGPALVALVVANVTPAKGHRELLASLGRALGPDVSLRLTLVGSLERDGDYSAVCLRSAGEHPELRERVQFVGALPHEGVILRMAESDVLVSASRMESYGMALAEARAVGLPILAVRGGNVEQHVDERAGGAIFDDADALAIDLVRLARDPVELRRRRMRASLARTERSWDQAAAEFLGSFGAALGIGGHHR